MSAGAARPMSTHPLQIPAAAPAPLNVFERNLTLWVVVCIVTGGVVGL